MNIKALLITLVGVAGLAAALPQAARANEVLYDSIGFMQGQQSFSDSFSVDGPGTLTVTLSDIAWPVPLASLNFVLGTAQEMLGPVIGPGTASYQVSGGNLVAQWFGTAQGPMATGVYGLKLEFTPATVPLPTAIALLLSGLALLAWQRRRPGEMTAGEMTAGEMATQSTV